MCGVFFRMSAFLEYHGNLKFPANAACIWLHMWPNLRGCWGNLQFCVLPIAAKTKKFRVPANFANVLFCLNFLSTLQFSDPDFNLILMEFQCDCECDFNMISNVAHIMYQYDYECGHSYDSECGHECYNESGTLMWLRMCGVFFSNVRFSRISWKSQISNKRGLHMTPHVAKS